MADTSSRGARTDDAARAALVEVSRLDEIGRPVVTDEHMRGADDGAKLVNEVERCGRHADLLTKSRRFFFAGARLNEAKISTWEE